MVVLGYKVQPLVSKTLKEILDDNLLGLSAQTAYYFFFSLFPLLLFVAPLLSLVGNKQETFGLLAGQLQQVVPSEGWSLIGGRFGHDGLEPRSDIAQQRQHADDDDNDADDLPGPAVHRQHVDEIKHEDDDQEGDENADGKRHR